MLLLVMLKIKLKSISLYLNNNLRMKNITSVFLISSLAMTTACTTMKTTENTSTEMPAPDASMENNPFLQKSSLQYQAPEFNKIKDEHFVPAFKL